MLDERGVARDEAAALDALETALGAALEQVTMRECFALDGLRCACNAGAEFARGEKCERRADANLRVEAAIRGLLSVIEEYRAVRGVLG
jgi:hypothetical protein